MRLLIVEGNTPETTRAIEATGGRRQSEIFEHLLRVDGVSVQTTYPADVGAVLPGDEELLHCHGVVWTGSALNIYQGGAEVVRQVELARRILRLGGFIYGSCWGLQVAVAACGGEVFPNPRGREFGVASGIAANDAGSRHPLLRGREGAFEALALHRDIVGELSEAQMTILAYNELCPVQAAELRYGKGLFWGVQYHPEYSFRDIASGCRRYGEGLVREGFYRDLEEVNRVADWYGAADGGDTDQAEGALARLGISGPVVRPEFRSLEIFNWLGEVGARASAVR